MQLKEKKKLKSKTHIVPFAFWFIICGASMHQRGSQPTGVRHCIGAVGRTLGVGGDNRGGGSHWLDGGGHWVDGEGGRRRTGRRRFYHSHLSALLTLRVGRHSLAVHWFGGWQTQTRLI